MSVSPRKNPSQARAVATVECVLEAAARILTERGLAGFNTNAVAKRAGVSVGSLYQYFPGKDAITAALIQRGHEDIVNGLRGLLAKTDRMNAQQAVTAMIEMVIAAAPRSPRLHQILEAEENRLDKTEETLVAERQIDELNSRFFRRYVDWDRCDESDFAVAVNDVMTIVRALLDSPGSDRATLSDRIGRAVQAYLAPLLKSA